MIDEDETFKLFGYHTTDLTPGSNKKVVAICDICGKIRILQFISYRDLCHKCACNTKEYLKKQSISQIGKHPVSLETRKNLSIKWSGDSNPMKQPEVRLKITGENNPAKRPEVRLKISKNNPMRRTEIKINFVGENNPAKQPGSRRKIQSFAKRRYQNVRWNRQVENFIDGNSIIDWIDKPKDWRNWKTATYLNTWFDGCHRHHLTENIVIHIPSALHKSIQHGLHVRWNMSKINELAIIYLLGNNDTVYFLEPYS